MLAQILDFEESKLRLGGKYNFKKYFKGVLKRKVQKQVAEKVLVLEKISLWRNSCRPNSEFTKGNCINRIKKRLCWKTNMKDNDLRSYLLEAKITMCFFPSTGTILE